MEAKTKVIHCGGRAYIVVTHVDFSVPKERPTSLRKALEEMILEARMKVLAGRPAAEE